MPNVRPLVDNLFRREASKLVAALTRVFGTHNMALAEDVMQDTLIKAMENWRINGVPKNPTGWLFTVARNKALDVIRSERSRKEFSSTLSPLLISEYTAGETIRQWINEDEIEDEQLRMMFACCDPEIPQEGQVALILKTLCGFSVAEIASSFLTGEDNIEKRLYRARHVLREGKVAFAIPAGDQLNERLDGVLTAVYLLFNEGYNSTRHISIIRDDLVDEALRLGKMIADHPITKQPESLALLALMCFQAARLYGRVDKNGNLLTLREQTRSSWDQALIRQGASYLKQASVGTAVSSYHYEAAIAYEHCSAESYASTDWTTILNLYDQLYAFKPHPLIELNRLIAYGELNGATAALAKAEELPSLTSLREYYLYPVALADWHAKAGNLGEAKRYFEEALSMTQSASVGQFLHRKIREL